jgi:hypothetical protein
LALHKLSYFEKETGRNKQQKILYGTIPWYPIPQKYEPAPIQISVHAPEGIFERNLIRKQFFDSTLYPWKLYSGNSGQLLLWGLHDPLSEGIDLAASHNGDCNPPPLYF